jgi:hypothetical protein
MWLLSVPLFRKTGGETINTAYIESALAKFLANQAKMARITVLGLVSVLK